MNAMDEKFAAELRRVLVERVEAPKRRRAHWPWVAGAFVGVTLLGGTSVAMGVPIPLTHLIDDKVETAVVSPEERAVHDAILDIPLVEEGYAAETALARHGLFREFTDVLGTPEIDGSTGEFLVRYDHTAEPSRVALFLERLTLAARESSTRIVPIPAGYASEERSEAAMTMLKRPDIAELMGVNDVSGAGYDHETGRLQIFTPADVEPRVVHIDGEDVALVGSVGFLQTGFGTDSR